jgi:3-keto steroid reductase
MLDSEIDARRQAYGFDEHAKMFRQNLRVDVVPIDLLNANSILDFCDAIGVRYPFISHLILNAGAGDFNGVDWRAAVWDCLTNLVRAVTFPSFKVQRVGRLSSDGLGWVWQCNVFGHYLMMRNLQPVLERCPHSSARILWTSSIEAQVNAFGFDDWQLVQAPRSYEASKYQTFLVGHALGERAARDHSKVRHYIVHPGVVAGSMFKAYLGWLLDKLMVMTFYIARLFGSPHHCISAYKGAISAVHICLVSIALLPLATVPVSFGSRTDRWGREFVNVDYIEGWADREESTEKMLDKFDALSASLEKRWDASKKNKIVE